MYRVHWNQAAAAHSSLYFFIFLSSFQTLKFFVTLFSGTVRPRRLKLGTHMDSGQMCRVHRNQAAAAYSSLYFFIIPPVHEVYRGYIVFVFSVTMFVVGGGVFVCKLFFFVKDFSGTTESRILKFGTNVGYNLLYCVRENQPPPAYHSHYLSIFLSLQ